MIYLEKLAHKISSFFVEYGNASEEDRDIYEYGIIIALSTLMNLFITLCIGLILNIPYQLIAYIIPFFLLRSSAGGYHAKTFWGCVIASSFIILTVVLLVRYTPNSHYFLLVFLFSIVSIAIILLFAPAISPDQNVDLEYPIIPKKRSLIFTVISIVVEIIFYFLNMYVYMFCISVGMLTASITLLPSIFIRLVYKELHADRETGH